MSMPTAKDKLFVIRHIADYEPMPLKGKGERYAKDIETKPKKIWPSVPMTYNHKR